MCSSLSPLRMTASLKVQFIYSRPLMCGKLTLNLRSSFLPDWLSITKLLRLITWLKKVGLTTPCALCVIANQNQFIISLQASTTSRLSGMPLLPTSTSRIMPLWAPIKVCCSGSQSSIGQVAEKIGGLNSAFSFPFGGNGEKKEIGECFRLKRNPSYMLLLSFRMR
jgi:hypothetical protein